MKKGVPKKKENGTSKTNNKPFIITGFSQSNNAKALVTDKINTNTNRNVENNNASKNTTTNKPIAKDLPNKSDSNWNQKKKIIKSNLNDQHKNKSQNNWWSTANQDRDLTAPLLLLSEGNKWFNLLPANINDYLISDKKTDDSNQTSIDTKVLEIIKTNHDNELTIFHKFKSTSIPSKSDEKWINDVIKSGTLSDKVAALALRVQESPPHNLESLDILINMANKKEQRTSQLALEALKDLFINSLLPDRKLNYINNYNILHNNMDMKIGLLLYFENCLKIRMERIIEGLELGLKSSVDFFKRLCLSMASELLINKPEQEAKLLSMIGYLLLFFNINLFYYYYHHYY